MRKDRLSTTIDLVLLILFMVASIFVCYNIYMGNFLNSFWTWVILCFMILFLIAMFVWILAFKKGVWIRRILMGVISLLLLFAGFYFGHLHMKTTVKTVNVETYYRMYLISDAENVDELKDDTIGVLMSDRNHLNSFEDVNEAFGLKDCSFREFFNLSTLIDALRNDSIQGVILEEHNRELFKKQYHFPYKELSENVHRVQVSHTPKLLSLDQPFSILLNISKQKSDIRDASATSECVILLIDPLAKKISSIELPADLYVPNVVYDSYPDALYNTSYNGIDNIMYSLETIFGIEFDYFIKIPEISVFGCIDLLRGISMEYPMCEEDVCTVVNEVAETQRASELYNEFQSVNMLLEGIFEKRSALVNTTLMSFLNYFNNSSFTNLPMSDLRALVEMSTKGVWQFETMEFQELPVSVEPCISLSGESVTVTLMDVDFLHHVYQQFLEMKHMEIMNHFEFDLDRMREGKILPSYNEKIILTSNMNWKIDEYYAFLPESAIHPIEAEKWEGTIRFDKINYDPDAPITSLE